MRIPSPLRGLAAYLSDWKNLASHAAVGVLLVVIPLALPLPPVGRLGVFFAIVGLNLIRMRLEKARAARKEAAEAAP
jgi:hypothetical protein